MRRFLGSAACAAILIAAMSACGGGGGGGSSTGGVPPTQAPSIAPSTAPTTKPQSATCPSTGPSATSVAVQSSARFESNPVQSVRRIAGKGGADAYIPGLIAVTYASDAVQSRVDDEAAAQGARPTGAMRFDAIGLKARILRVDPSRVNGVLTRLRATPGVISVERAQYRYLLNTVTVNDPYYDGFGAGAPYFQTSSTPGQWDMHVINVGAAWGDYSSLPAHGAKIAVIDTGVDVTHPEMHGKVVRQACYVTYPSSSAQTTSGFAVDTDGHGTNVAGIADADTNNAFGFAGVGFDAPLMAYRIFPTTPSGGCIGSSSAQCSSTTIDEVSALNDAVAHGARVINLSLGSDGPLSNCQSSLEENAIESAISHGVVVVAASGNGNSSGQGQAFLDCPAAYPGVIAVGSEGPSGASNAEAVAPFSNYLTSSGTGTHGAYLVAPGGVATSGTDSNSLHFVENITSGEMADSAQFCTLDFAGESHDCRAGYSGTSQATPHVAGVVSLILGLRPALTPAQVASIVCSTAHSIANSKQGCGRLDAAAAVAKALTF